MSGKSKNNTDIQPELRFPKFSDASGWEEYRFDEIYSFITTNSLSREKLNYNNGTIKNIHYGDIHTKFRALFDIEKEYVPFVNSSENGQKYKEENFCIESDVIFADASEDLNDVGKSIEIVNLSEQRLISGLHTLHARQKEEKLVVGFGAYLFQSNSLRTQIKKQAQGAKVLGISAGRLSSVKISYPQDKNEQKKIADCLSSLDELIEVEGHKLEALQSHKKGLMQDLFPVEGETLPKRRFAEFKDAPKWGETVLGNIGEVLSGYGFPEKYQGQRSGEYPFYKVSDISASLARGEHFINKAANYIDGKTLKLLGAKPLPIGTTIFARIGEAIRLNRRVVTTIPCVVDNNVAGLKTTEGQATDLFLYYTLLRVNLADYAGGAVPSVNKSALENISIVCPQLDEQKRVADFLSSIDDLINTQRQKIDALRGHKKGLMQRLFPIISEAQE